MRDWAAYAEFTADSALDFDEELAEDLCRGFSAVVSVSGDRNRVALAFAVEAGSLFEALGQVERTAYAVVGLLSTRGARAVRPVQMKIGTNGDMAVETFGTGQIPLVGYTEIATMGGFSRQYARELARKSDFPPQVATVSGSPAFFRPEVEDYLEKIGKLRVARIGVDWMFGERAALTASPEEAA